MMQKFGNKVLAVANVGLPLEQFSIILVHSRTI